MESDHSILHTTYTLTAIVAGVNAVCRHYGPANR